MASAAIVAAIFAFALPRFASYRSAWASMDAMTWQQALLVAAAAVGSMVLSWMVICSVLPSVRLREAAVVNLGSSAVANTLPAGGALAMGVSWAMLSGWGISTADYVLYTLVSGIWNVFARLALPVIALLVMVTVSRPGTALPGRDLPAFHPPRRPRLPGVAARTRAYPRRPTPPRSGPGNSEQELRLSRRLGVVGQLTRYEGIIAWIRR